MARQRNELHQKQFEAWKSQNNSLPLTELNQLLIIAIQAVRQRSLTSLSNVTVVAVVDRALHESIEKFSVLSGITSDLNGLDFGKFSNHSKNSQPEEIQKALRELLIELLDVFGKITAEILTKYLHQELMSVTKETVISDIAPTSINLSGTATKNREKK